MNLKFFLTFNDRCKNKGTYTFSCIHRYKLSDLKEVIKLTISFFIRMTGNASVAVRPPCSKIVLSCSEHLS